MNKQNKAIWVAFGVWCAIVLFVPMKHILHTPDDLMGVATVLVGVPFVALVLLVYQHYRPVWWLSRDIVTIVILVVMFALAMHLIAVNVESPFTWSYPTTIITVLFLILLIIWKGQEDARTILVAVIVGAFMIGAFEIPYLLTRPLAGLPYTGTYLLQMCFMVLPFLLIIKMLRPTLWTAVLFILWVVLWVIWVVPLGRWDICLTATGEPVQWLPYQLSKGIKLLLVPLLYSFRLR